MSDIPTFLFAICGGIVLAGLSVLIPVIWLCIQLIRQKIDPGLSDRRGYRYLGFFEL